MAAEQEPHQSRSVHTAALSVQEGSEERGELGPFLLFRRRQAMWDGDSPGGVHRPAPSLHPQQRGDAAGFLEAGRSPGHQLVPCPVSEPSFLKRTKGKGLELWRSSEFWDSRRTKGGVKMAEWG